MSRPRRIVVNTAIYLHGTSGSATATRALVDALRALPDVEVVEVSPPSRGGSSAWLNAYRDARWDLWGAARAAPDVDLLVSPCNIGLRGPARRHLLVVYDVMVFDRPELFDRRFAAYFRLLVPFSVRRADRVLTMSEHAAGRLRRMDPTADVRVIAWPYPGGERSRISYPTEKTVLMVGATEPVKNHVAGIRAVAALRDQVDGDVRLCVIGPIGRAEADVRVALAAVDPHAAWTSREVDIPRDRLEAAYESAWLLLQPSIDEGFGLPLLEAARHGLPVVHSGRGAMPQLLPTGDAGGVAPHALTAAMAQLLNPDAWERCSDDSYSRTRLHTPDLFRAALAHAAADLLPVPA